MTSAPKEQRKQAGNGVIEKHNRGRREKRYSLNAHCQEFLTINRGGMAEKSRDREYSVPAKMQRSVFFLALIFLGGVAFLVAGHGGSGVGAFKSLHADMAGGAAGI